MLVLHEDAHTVRAAYPARWLELDPVVLCVLVNFGIAPPSNVADAYYALWEKKEERRKMSVNDKKKEKVRLLGDFFVYLLDRAPSLVKKAQIAV